MQLCLYIFWTLTCTFTNAYLSPSVLASILNDSNAENKRYTGFFCQILSDITGGVVIILSVS